MTTKKAWTITQLAKFDLKNSPGALATLPAPERSCMATASPSQQLKVAASYIRQAIGILADEVDVPATLETECPDCGAKTRLRDEAVRERVLLSLMAYYDYAVHNAIESDSMKSDDVTATLGIWLSKRLTGAPVPDEPIESRLRARLFVTGYLVGLVAGYFVSSFRRLDFNRLPGMPSLEDLAHAELARMHDYERQAPNGPMRIMMHRLLHSSLHLLGKTYRSEDEALNKEHRYGPFSMIRLNELALLAKREPAMLKRYGEKQVERVFEQQLALVMQSFGLYVVPSRVAEDRVDLICIADSPTRVTFLLEAKTSRKPYSLPTKDARAVVDYVADVQKALTTLPRLEFVLVVSGQASKTLADKLRVLEARVGVPVRFCDAQELAELREMSIGPIPMDMLKSGIITGPHILPRGFLVQIVQRQRQAQEAHANFVRGMMDVHKLEVPSLTASWPEDHES